ncbi:MAG: hypothetical protein NTZ49_05795 [Candidatus Parcubacteria bacterium]|nr:hypothetical protein [Candidatus Parcubacteria bacterium]
MAKIKNNSNSGFAIIEILIGLGLFAIIFVGSSLLLLNNVQGSFDNQEKIKADFLVAEGLEAVKAIAGNDWNKVPEGTYGLALNNNQWQLVSEPEKVEQMAKKGERIIQIKNINGNDLKKVESRVVWLSITDKVKESNAITYISNWHSYVSVCADGLDNDGDGNIDYPNDPGCSSSDDEDEYNPNNPPSLPVCADGLDNDGDGNIDYPNDPGCDSAVDDDETDPPVLPVCSDGLDNDGDGNIDYPNDPGCSSANDDDETDPLNPPQCSDNEDNDADGAIDYPQDTDCDDANDDNEDDPVVFPQCSDKKDNDGDANTDYTNDPGCDSPDDDDETDPLCGNGRLETGEDCDDNNAVNGDGCSSECIMETDPEAVCGNGIIESSEECDLQAAPKGCKYEIEACQNNCKCKVPICHVTSAEKNPYEMIWVNYNAVDGEGENDHSHHLGDIIPIGDVNNDGELNDDDCLASQNQVVVPDVIFNDEDTPLCKIEPGILNVAGKIVMPEGISAKLQLSYYIVWPEDKRTEINYVNYGTVKNGDLYAIDVDWPGVRPGELKVEVHVGAILLDLETEIPIMANGSSLDYYWYPWVCPAPVTECFDALDNDGDGLIDYSADPNCLSALDDTEGSDDCGTAIDNQYNMQCNNDDDNDDIEIKIINNNDRGLSHVAIALPPDVIPLTPKDGEIYVGSHNTYKVSITNNPYYSIKFDTIGEGIKNGEEDIFIIAFSSEDYAKYETFKVQTKSSLIIGNGEFKIIHE